MSLQKLFQNLFILFLIISSIDALSFLGKQKSKISPELEKISQNDFGKNLLEIISMQLETGGPLSDISDIFSDFLEDIEIQDFEASQLKEKIDQKCKKFSRILQKTEINGEQSGRKNQSPEFVQCASWRNRYDSGLEERNQQRQVILDIQNLLTENLDIFSDSLKF